MSTREVDPLRVFDRDALIREVVAHLHDATFENGWAWQLVWFGAFAPHEHLALVRDVVDRAPDDNGALWRIGDGPIGELEMQPELQHEIERLQREHPTWKRIRELVVADLETGNHNDVDQR